MTSSLEKVFFNYILNNPKYYDIILPYFFRNKEIQFVYEILRNYRLKNPDSQKPSPRQILDMVMLEDKNGIITKEILKSILNTNLLDYDEENFIKPKFNSWILINRVKTGTVDIIDETRKFDTLHDFDEVVDSVDKIKSIVKEMGTTNFIEDEDIGSDFDDPNSHVQDNSKYKVKSGFSTIDHILGGGWDIQTLNILMAETNNGKCHFVRTKCHILNKISGFQSEMDMEELLTYISKGG